jgi:hypothetical protein
MQRLIVMTVLITGAWVVGACSGAPDDTTQPIDIALRYQPDPPTMGDNTFDVEVKRGITPVTDATVSLELYMAAMPDMKMPEMRTNVQLSQVEHDGGGRYRGKGNIAMAGTWDATVKVMRGGQEVGSRKFSVTAKQ